MRDGIRGEVREEVKGGGKGDEGRRGRPQGEERGGAE